MNYSQQDFNSVTLSENSVYMTLDNPQFEGQTRVDSNGEYIMYFSNNGTLYGFKHTL